MGDLIKIKNMAEFKRFLKVGQKLVFTNVDESGKITQRAVRTITVVQSNSFALTSPRDPSVSSWHEYPKAKDVTFIQCDNQNTVVKVKNDVMGGYLLYSPVGEL